jgi:hypothetical protein
MIILSQKNDIKNRITHGTEENFKVHNHGINAGTVSLDSYIERFIRDYIH